MKGAPHGEAVRGTGAPGGGEGLPRAARRSPRSALLHPRKNAHLAPVIRCIPPHRRLRPDLSAAASCVAGRRT